MSKLVVKVGLPLDKSLIYYHDMLIKHRLDLQFACFKHDLYYTKENLDGLSENEMKDACIRLRNLEGVIGKNKRPKDKVDKIKEQEKDIAFVIRQNVHCIEK